jgi:oligosaccharyltransferase complex subunit gamma
MKFLQALTWSLLPLAALAAKKSPKVEKFDKFHKKALSSSPIKMGDSEYETLTKAPRDYSVAILLTAMEAQYGCQPCRDFKPEWELLASSWVKGDKAGESRLLFGTLDFADAKLTFQQVGFLLPMRAFVEAPEQVIDVPPAASSTISSYSPFIPAHGGTRREARRAAA